MPMKYSIVQTRKDLKLIKRRGYDLSLLGKVVDTLAAGEKLPQQNQDHPVNYSATSNRDFPRQYLKLVLAWCELHKDELMQNWELAKETQDLQKINPLT